MLQPMAAIGMLRTSSRPLSSTLSVPVRVSTMNRPNSTSETRSTGSSTRELLCSSMSSVMVSLSVAPVLVLLSHVIGPTPMDLQFWPGAWS